MLANDGWRLTPGPMTDKSVLPTHSYGLALMRYGQLFLAAMRARPVPPTGVNGLNLAVADVALLSPALDPPLRKRRPRRGRRRTPTPCLSGPGRRGAQQEAPESQQLLR